MLESQVRLLNLNIDMGVVPMDYLDACIVPLYKGKGDICECSNSRAICLLIVVGKLYGIIIIKKGRQCKAERVIYTLSNRRPQPPNTDISTERRERLTW